jgi:Polyketide cyclase / dehydrase and lipid transport
MGFRSFRPVEADFLANAPRLITTSAVVAAPRPEVFAALSGDPATWTWFPGFSDQGKWLTDGPRGAGSRREVRVGGISYRETILVWEEPERWGFRVDEATAPIAHALAEEYRLVADGDQTVVHWTFCADGPALLNALLGSPLSRPVLGRLWRRACANLESRLVAAP